MCRRTILRNEPHELTIAINRISMYQCVQSLIYKTSDRTRRYCYLCRSLVGRYETLKPAYFHGINIGNLLPESCDRCEESTISIHKIIECQYCWSKYPNFMNTLKQTGHPIDRIISLTYDCVNNSFLSLVIQGINN